MKNAVLSTDIKAQYDECVKKLLGRKIILAHILAKSIDEFRGMRPEEVVHLIEGEPLISKVPVELGLTNKIVGVDEKGNEIVSWITGDKDSIMQDMCDSILSFTYEPKMELRRLS